MGEPGWFGLYRGSEDTHRTSEASRASGRDCTEELRETKRARRIFGRASDKGAKGFVVSGIRGDRSRGSTGVWGVCKFGITAYHYSYPSGEFTACYLLTLLSKYKQF